MAGYWLKLVYDRFLPYSWMAVSSVTALSIWATDSVVKETTDNWSTLSISCYLNYLQITVTDIQVPSAVNDHTVNLVLHLVLFDVS
jgi:hypothetical protein